VGAPPGYNNINTIIINVDKVDFEVTPTTIIFFVGLKLAVPLRNENT